MPKTNYIQAPQSRVATEPVVPGSLIFTDENRLYWDSPDSVRYEIADILELATELERQAIGRPLNKFYYVLSTNTLYRYNNGWKNLSAGTGGGGGTGTDYELTIDKLIPFAGSDEPAPVGSISSAGISGLYARADHSHKFNSADLKLDSGYFKGSAPPTPVSIHNVSILSHPYLVVDGNAGDIGRTDYPGLTDHTADPLAHRNMVVDGNDRISELTDLSLPLHAIAKHPHGNFRVDGNLVAGK